MIIEIDLDNAPKEKTDLRIGNVYSVKGGRGLQKGHMMIVIAITEPIERWDTPMVLCLTIDKQGRPRGVTSYSVSYMEERMPIAFCEGVDAIRLKITSL